MSRAKPLCLAELLQVLMGKYPSAEHEQSKTSIFFFLLFNMYVPLIPVTKGLTS